MGSLRSDRTTVGRTSSVARALWRATGIREQDFGKPIIAVANSFTQFVPGHVHLKDVGQLVVGEIEAAGAIAKEFNTIAVDDGIAMGHDGMLYSLPSRDLIADSVEYMVDSHCADALVCISNCDKITPGMLLAALRLNIPTVFVSGGPMEAGRSDWTGSEKRISGVEALIAQGDPTSTDEKIAHFERSACPTCGSCSGMFTANSMNCLLESLGLALPGNGTVLATHADRRGLFVKAAHLIVSLCRRYYGHDDQSVLPRAIATFEAFENAIRLDVAMGGSTNTILHLLAAAHEAKVDFRMADIDRISRSTPHLSKLAPSTSDYYVEDVHRAGGVLSIMAELDRLKLIHRGCATVHAPTIGQAIDSHDIMGSPSEEVVHFFKAAPGGVPTIQPFSQNKRHEQLDTDRVSGCVRDGANAYSSDGGLAILFGNLAPEGCVVKTAGVEESILRFTGQAVIFESENDAEHGISNGGVVPGDVVVIRYEGPRGGPGMQEMLKPTSLLKANRLHDSCALITDGRFSGGSAGLSIGHVSPEAAAGGLIALVEPGDRIEIDIPARSIHLAVSDEVLAERRRQMLLKPHPWEAVGRDRRVSEALQAYGLMVTSAATGAVRDVAALKRQLRELYDFQSRETAPETEGAAHD